MPAFLSSGPGMLIPCFSNYLPFEEAVAELLFYPLSTEGTCVLEAQVMNSPASITRLQSTGNLCMHTAVGH